MAMILGILVIAVILSILYLLGKPFLLAMDSASDLPHDNILLRILGGFGTILLITLLGFIVCVVVGLGYLLVTGFFELAQYIGDSIIK